MSRWPAPCRFIGSILILIVCACARPSAAQPQPCAGPNSTWLLSSLKVLDGDKDADEQDELIRWGAWVDNVPGGVELTGEMRSSARCADGLPNEE